MRSIVLDAGGVQDGERAVGGQARAGVGVQREQHRMALGDLGQRRGDRGHPRQRVHVLGPVQRDEDVLAFDLPDGLPRAQRARGRLAAAHDIGQRAADVVDGVRRHALGDEVVAGLVARRQQRLREAVDQRAVDLVGRAPVKGAQAGVEVGDGHAVLGRGERAAKRRVQAAGDDDERGRHVEQQALDLDQHRAGLHRRGRRVEAEAEVCGTAAERGQRSVERGPGLRPAGVHEERASAGRAQGGGDGGDAQEAGRPAADEHDRGRRGRRRRRPAGAAGEIEVMSGPPPGGRRPGRSGTPGRRRRAVRRGRPTVGGRWRPARRRWG